MSRTYKDRPARIKHPDQFDRNDEDKWDRVPYEAEGYGYYDNEYYNEIRYFSVKKPGVYQKKKKLVDTEWRWMSTPGWWVRLRMNRPQRIAYKKWEKEIVQGSIDALEDVVVPYIGHKPHIYYW